MGLVGLLVTLTAMWSTWVCADEQLNASPVAPTIVQPPVNANERNEFASAAQASQPSAVIPHQPDVVPAGADAVLKDIPVLKDVPLNTAESRLQDNPDFILNAKPPSDNPPPILKSTLFSPPDLNNNKPVQGGKPVINERKKFAGAQASQPPAAIPHSPDVNPADAQTVIERIFHDTPNSILNAKYNPPPILKDILFTPPELINDKHVQEGKSIFANPTLYVKPTLNEKLNLESNDKPSLVDKPFMSSPRILSARAVVFPSADDSPAPPAAQPTEELKKKLEESLIKIKEAINEASPALIAAAGASKVKSATEDNTEKPEEPTVNKSYAVIIGQVVANLLEIPILLLGAFREFISGLTTVSVQVSNQHKPLSTEKHMVQK